ncbi:MAG: hypothetical protein ACYCZN_15680 [Candidatus Dormibacteria bacterium]
MDEPTGRLSHRGVDITHDRLPELLKLADAAEPFYNWVAREAQQLMSNELTLSRNLTTMTEPQIRDLIQKCHAAARTAEPLPVLSNGVGRSYPHQQAVYYFFAWILRDAPQQRLGPLISKVQSKTPRELRNTTQAEVLAKLFIAYRPNLRTFDWEAMREIIVDRLEGSRRSIKGRQAEVVARTAVSTALAAAYSQLGGYGNFSKVAVADGEVTVRGETFDVSVSLMDDAGQVQAQILIPVKTRETEGGGHANLFTRDIDSAMSAIRAQAAVSNTTQYWLAAIIVAANWADDQMQHVTDVCDFTISLKISPTAFSSLVDEQQSRFNDFILGVLRGTTVPKL